MNGPAAAAVTGTHPGGNNGMGGLEIRVVTPHLQKLVEDALEAAEVGFVPIAPGTLALLDDLFDRTDGAGQVGHRHQLRPLKGARPDLGFGWSDEKPFLAHPLGEVGEALFDAPVEMSDRSEVLQPRSDIVLAHQGQSVIEDAQSVGVVELHPLRALEVHEVTQRLFAEGEQGQPDARGIVSSGLGQVRAGEMRGCAEGGEHVGRRSHSYNITRAIRGVLLPCLSTQRGRPEGGLSTVSRYICVDFVASRHKIQRG